MLNNEKIGIMTKLAVYEKNKGKEDIRMMEYFKTDYISSKNFSIQIGVTLGLVFILGADFANIFLENLGTITEYDFVGLGKKYLFIWISLMVVYTLVSTLYNRYEYTKAEKRIKQYETLLKKIEKY